MIMSMQATFGAADGAVDGAASQRRGGPGFFSRLARRFIDARTQTAKARVQYELGGLSDSHLRALGLTDRQITDLRFAGRTDLGV